MAAGGSAADQGQGHRSSFRLTGEVMAGAESSLNTVTDAPEHLQSVHSIPQVISHRSSGARSHRMWPHCFLLPGCAQLSFNIFFSCWDVQLQMAPASSCTPTRPLYNLGCGCHPPRRTFCDEGNALHPQSNSVATDHMCLLSN